MNLLSNFIPPSLKHWRPRSLRAKLLVPLVGLMLVSLLGSTLAFVGGTAFTRNRLVRQRVSIDAEKVTQAMKARTATISDAATVLANDPYVYESVGFDTEEILKELNARAVLVRNRFNLDLIQVYDKRGRARANILLSTLYRESQLIDYVTADAPVVRVVEGRVLLLSRAEMPEEAGTVVTGLDLETELHRITSNYRLSTDLGLVVADSRVSSREEFPFEVLDGSRSGYYSQRLPLELGESSVDLLLVRPTEEITRVTNTGLGVMVGSALLTTLLLIILSVRFSESIAQPIQRLSTAAEAVARGDLSQHVEVAALSSPFGIGKDDEISSQATAFNTMVAELRSLYDDLEGKVEARTRELATAARVARAVSSSLDLDFVLPALLQSIHEQLDLHLVALFLVEHSTDVGVIHEAVGAGSERLKAQSFRFKVDSPSILGRAVATGTTQVIQHVKLEPVTLKIYEFPDVGSAAVIPLVVGQDVQGVLYVQHVQPEAFTPELVNLLVTLSDQIAIGVQNVRLYEMEQRRRRFAELLEATGRTLASSLDLEKVLARILRLLDDLVAYDRGLLLLRSDDRLKPRATYGFPDEERVHQIEIPITEDGIFTQIVESRGPLVLADVTQEAGWRQLPWLPLHRSWMGIPVIAKGEVIGMVSLTRREANAFDLEDTMWVQAFAMQAGIALENAQLYAEIAEFNEDLERLVRERTEELDRAYRALEQLDKTKSDFIEVAAHELRTPLTVIKGCAFLVQQLTDGEQKERLASSVEGICSGVDRLHEIVNSMLDVAKIDSQTLKTFKSETRLSHVIEQVCNNLEPDLEERHLKLTLDGLDTLPAVYADPDLLCKVFDNLIVNAIKYTPDGGEIEVSGCLIAQNGYGPAVEVVVSDTGIGIDPEHHELIFEKFYQTGEVAFHSTGRTKFKGGGPGLGLAIVRGIVAAHDGEIWVESEGHDETQCPGSRFYVRFPLGSENKEPSLG